MGKIVGDLCWRMNTGLEDNFFPHSPFMKRIDELIAGVIRKSCGVQQFPNPNSIVVLSRSNGSLSLSKS